MSYQLRVLKDNPMGFWNLESGSGTDKSCGLFVSGTRTFNNATVGAGVSSTDVLPICTGDNNAVKINSTSTSKVTIPNNYTIMYKGNEAKEFSLEFFVAFDSIPTSARILTIGSTLTLDFVDSVAVLAVTDSDSKTTYGYVDIPSYESQMNVCIQYSNKKFKLIINGLSETTATLYNGAYFKDTSSAATSIVFGPYAASGSGYYILDAIAIYPYLLSPQQIKAHLIWSMSDSNPTIYTIASGGGYINPDEEDGHVDQQYLYDKDDDWKSGTLDNLIVDKGVLTSRFIPKLKAYSPIENNPIEAYTTVSSKTGLVANSVTTSSLMKDFQSFFNPNTSVITAQLYYNSTGTIKKACYFYITGFSFGSLVVERMAGATQKVRIYSPKDSSIDIQFTVTTTGWKNLKIEFTGSQISVTFDGTTTTKASSYGNIEIAKSEAYFANYYEYDASSVLVSYPNDYPIANFSIFTKDSSRYTYFVAQNDYTIVGDLTVKFNSKNQVSQYGEWRTILPTISDSNIVATRLYATLTSNNISIYGSSDGVNWIKQGTRGEQLPGFVIGTTGSPTYLKITMDIENSEYARPAIDFMEIKLYSSLYASSHGSPFRLESYTPSLHTYQFRNRSHSLLARDLNFGVHFEPATSNVGEVPGMGIVNIPSGLTYRTVEFWFRVDSNPGATTNYILDTKTPSSAGLSHNASLILSLQGTDWTSTWINGQAWTSGSRQLVLDEIYHFVGVFSSDKSNEIYMNAKKDYTQQSNITFGYFSLYSGSKDQTFALKKYNKHLGLDSNSVVDSQTITLSDSAKVYKNNWQSALASIQS